MVKRNKAVTWFWYVAIAGLACGAIGLIAAIVGLLVSQSGAPISIRVLFADLLLLVLLLGVSIVVLAYLAPMFQRHERLRHRAAVGIGRLDREQPVPDPDALPLPTTIEIRPKWATVLGLVAVLVVIVALVEIGMVLLFIAGGLLESQRHRSANGLLWLIPLAIIMIILFTVYFYTIVGVARERIEVTTEGMVVRWHWRTRRIRWQDARLFGMTATTKDNARPAGFELSGADTILQWARYKHRRFLIAQPTMSWSEYEREMDALLSLIAAKTHLPLYDLSPIKQRSETTSASYADGADR